MLMTGPMLISQYELNLAPFGLLWLRNGFASTHSAALVTHHFTIVLASLDRKRTLAQ